ncbi:hypothetical protein [Trinickia fusca]|uniref:Uncharacterized protein n=1 Tax=Trinickia fusca TaxID=2419777 RepID=A0A494XBD6_9BURK|nr:hypothetical protein [Trinickia fusca]RKP46941.1 hypothetical protein D7S89_16465 [Trinickia fusca]
MKTKMIAALLLAYGMPIMAMAQSIAAPTLREGDSWTYVNTEERGASGWHQTHDEVAVQRVTDSHVYFFAKQAGSMQSGNEIIAGSDWSRIRELNGTDVVVNRPLAFPLEIGKSWVVQFTEPHPNAKISSATWTTKYKIIGYEDVQVPAGKFHALKIEAEGDWRAQVAPSNTVVQTAQAAPDASTLVTQTQRSIPETTAGHTYKAFWYVPEVGRWVKSVEEIYSSNGTRSERSTAELESYKRTGQ